MLLLRGSPQVTIFALVSLVFIVNSVLAAQSSHPTLYCVSDPSISFVTTLNASLPQAQCFRVQNGIFTEVLTKLPDSNQEGITFLDGYVLPGIIESHGHILQYGEMLESVSLYDSKSMDEVRTRIKQFLEKHRGEGYGARDKWIRGIGWDQKYFEGVMPTAKELAVDPALSDLYIMLDRVDVHCVLTSQKVLDLLPDPLPEAPPGGVVVTDPGPGVFCDNAMDYIIFPLAPKPDVAQKTRWFKTAMAELNKVGIVGVGDAGMRPEDVRILENMANRGYLTIRINVMLECAERNTFCPEETKTLKLLNAPEGLGSHTLMLGGVKLFADGALGSWGAALLEPYSDKLETSGTMLINETELTTVVKKVSFHIECMDLYLPYQWFDAGFQVNVHAIGDRANRAAIDAFENVLGNDCEGCNDARRLRIEHAQIIHPDDQQRIAKLGIIPSIQPTHATSDMAYALSRLGEDRLSHSAYRMSSLFPPTASSIHSKYPGPVLGSDFPVEPPNPFHGMYAAVTRLNPATGTSPNGAEGWHLEEALSVKQALVGFTKNAAYGWFREGVTGKIEVGMWADWVVVDSDIFIDETGKSLRDVVVKETWVGGRRVFPVSGDPAVDKQKKEWRDWLKDVVGRWLGAETLPRLSSLQANMPLTGEEIAKHDSRESCWVIIHGKAYDVTEFLPEHPGGPKIILKYAGKDATEEFEPIHPPDTLDKYLDKSKHLGDVDMKTVEKEEKEESPEEKERQQRIERMPILEQCYNLMDFEAVARSVMKKTAWAYYSSGADDEITMRENHSAFHKIWFRPRILVDVEKIDFTTTMLGTKCDMPFYVTATALGKLGNPEGEVILTRAAKKHNVVQMIPTLASCSFDEIMDAAEGDQVQWMQLYVNKDRAITKKIVQHAEKRGCKGLFITVDAPQLGRREKDMRSKFTDTGSNVQAGSQTDNSQGAARAISSFIDPSLSWKDIPWFKSITKMPIILKGVQRVEDVIRAIESGVQGVVLSNHGGRQLDFARSGIEVLAEVMPVLRERGWEDRIEIFIDGGVRRATDIIKALCLGAKGVGIGRPFLYAMSAYGQPGVDRAMQLLKDEMEMNMRLIGCSSVDQLNPTLVDTRGLSMHTCSVPSDTLGISVYDPLVSPKEKAKL
ncbi:hypothetical protein EG329_003809 [Mollisiaceae sp. DMI_Dod_QoI]|nr:hypothetical protein EG329_003809 [Helotiales sp. DMI_Dod_QoI]